MILLGNSFIGLVQRKTQVLFWSLKSCWAELIYGWATILVSLCSMPGEVNLALHSTFTPPSTAIAPGFSLCRSQPDLSVFLRVPWFSCPSKNRLSVKNTWCFGTVLYDHSWPFDDSLRCLSFSFSRPVWAAPFPIQPQWLQVRVTRTHYNKNTNNNNNT